MDKEQELYLEEQRERDIALALELTALKDVTQQLLNAYKAPPEAVSVSGEVTVNTEKELAINNLQSVEPMLIKANQDVVEAIKQNKPLSSIKVDNFPEQKDTLKIVNLDELASYIQPMVEAILSKDLSVTVQKDTLQFPTSPKQAIPVRLSDGKSFYNASFQASVQGAMEVDPLVGYQIADEATSGSATYYGYVRKNGAWYIMRVLNKSYRYAVGAPRASGGGLYTDAWTNKANLTYSHFYEVW